MKSTHVKGKRYSVPSVKSLFSLLCTFFIKKREKPRFLSCMASGSILDAFTNSQVTNILSTAVNCILSSSSSSLLFLKRQTRLSIYFVKRRKGEGQRFIDKRGGVGKGLKLENVECSFLSQIRF